MYNILNTIITNASDRLPSGVVAALSDSELLDRELQIPNGETSRIDEGLLLPALQSLVM